jgi:hypothetical protein
MVSTLAVEATSKTYYVPLDGANDQRVQTAGRR